MEIRTIGVVGAGSMGSGIAQIAAQAGYNVVMRDIEEKFVANAMKGIDRFLAKSVEKGKLAADAKDAAMGRIKGTTKMEDLKGVDYVIEVVFENMDLKKSIFRELDALVRKDVIIATNTSSLSITEIAGGYRQTGQGSGHALLQPSTVDEARGGREEPVHERRHAEGGYGS